MPSKKPKKPKSTIDAEPLVGVLDCSSVKEFLEKIQSSSTDVLHPWASWVFRGQSNADWDLTPKVRRSGWRKLGGKKEPMPEIVTWREGQATWPSKDVTPIQAVQREFDLVAREFAGIVDEAGLEIPGDTHEWRNPDALRAPLSTAKFPPAEFRGLFALAQHYGIPTRLLDWTRRPLIAAYFACEDVAREQVEETGSQGTRLAVWALNETIVARATRWEPGPIMVTVPTVSNPNLRAQQGLFSLVRYQTETNANSKHIPSLDSLFAEKTQANVDRSGNELVPVVPALVKFTLPVTEAPVMLKMLSKKGIHGATVYPGLSGAVKARKEWLWHRGSDVDD